MSLQATLTGVTAIRGERRPEIFSFRNGNESAFRLTLQLSLRAPEFSSGGELISVYREDKNTALLGN